MSLSADMRQLLLALAIIAAAVVVGRLFRFLVGQARSRLASRTRTTLDDVILQASSAPGHWLFIALGLEIGLDRLFGEVVSLRASWSASLEDVFFTAYVLLAYWFFVRLVGGIASWYAREVAHLTETDVDDNFLNLFRHAAIIILTTIVLIIVLGRYGIEVSALVTTLGIGSLAVALAGQETLGNMIAGFTIMVDRPFTVGDRIEIQEIGTWGDVIEIGIRSTRIRTRDNRMVTVPNSVIGSNLVVNYSVPDTVFRVQTTVGVAYGTDLAFARRVMIDAVRAEPWVIDDRLVEALFLEFGDSALVFRVRCWIEDYMETRRVIDKLNTALYNALNREGIAIPFPQRDLHIVSGVTPVLAEAGES
jgi:small-conductance mechanosensitive channel